MADEKNTKPLSLLQRLSEVSDRVGMIRKSMSIKAGGESFKAVRETDVLGKIKPLEHQFGIYSFPLSRTVIHDEWLKETTNDQYGAKTKLKHIFTIEVVYRFQSVDDSKDCVDIVSYGTGIDTQDKAEGKAMTYADKYAILKAYKIPTGDEEDGDFGRDTSGDEEPEEPKAILCDECQKEITAFKTKNGQALSPAEIAAKTKNAYGATLCLACADKRKKAAAEHKKAAE